MLIRPLSVCLSVPSVCKIGVLWPNGWTDHDETWHAGRPSNLATYSVRWGPSSLPPKGHTVAHQFSAHICYCQMAEYIKMPLGMEVGFGPGDIVLDGDPTPPPQKGTFLPIFIVAKRLDG